jgi:primary-amine oxidase
MKSVNVPIAVSCLASLFIVSNAAAQCSIQIPATTFSVNQTFTTGTNWTLSFGRNPCEGLVLLFADFTPVGGVTRRVLYRGSIAQIHVPYQPGSPRFRDVGVSTSGMGANAIILNASECPGGTLYDGGRICATVEDRGFAWKFSTSSARGQELSLFMSSQLGNYTYINMWNFQDDGTIEVRTGLTGRLQIVDTSPDYLPYGSRLNPEGDPTWRIGRNHQHNIYYRLDFDIGTSSDNAINNISLQPSFDPSPVSSCALNGQCFVMQENQLLNETVDFISPVNFTSWRIYNKVITNNSGRNIGYELIPSPRGLGYGMYDTSEPWALGELWVTLYDPCHLLATDNHPPLISAGCAGTADNVTEMVAGAGDIDGQDIVVWYANRFTHYTRDEDQVNMPTEWISFEIQPRSFNHHSPFEP